MDFLNLSAGKAIHRYYIPEQPSPFYFCAVALKRYSRKEPMVFIWIMVPYILIMNLMILGSCIFSGLGTFLSTFGITVVYFSLVYGVFGSIAVVIRAQKPGAGDLFKRIGIMLPAFYVMNIGAVYGAYAVYDFLTLTDCSPRYSWVWWTILYGCIMSTLITFINEGMANWEQWKNSLAESEKLNSAFQRSKLLGLKGQINPHFLFNCFNTLSGLIDENEEEAEKFLDEMTKVHRYLLRGDDEHLVPLSEEIKFAASYLYLTKARFGNAIKAHIDIPAEMLQLRIPPLSLQVLLENIIYTNALSKKEPLSIRITHDDNHNLIIIHTIHEKTIIKNLSLDEGLDNLINKYRLMNTEEIRIHENPDRREIVLPLFEPIPISI